MKLEKMIELLEISCNVEYDINDFSDIVDLVYTYYLDSELFTEAEIHLLTNINGYNIETLNDALFARYGYRDLEQMIGEY